MSKKKPHRSPVTSRDRALDAIYAEIPEIPACTGACADACGPIAMTEGEWERIRRRVAGEPRMKGQTTCPFLSATGRCTVYSVRPYICRIWGSVRELRCPQGCEPTRWLTREEAHEIFDRVMAIGGPGTAGPLGNIADLKEAIGLDRRAARQAAIDKVRRQSGQ